MTAALVFLAYSIEVPSMGAKVGWPSYCTVTLASARVIVAVWGIELAMSASLASGVPGTEASTVALELSAGILAKSGGSSFPATKVQGPSNEALLNQRPEIKMK